MIAFDTRPDREELDGLRGETRLRLVGDEAWRQASRSAQGRLAHPANGKSAQRSAAARPVSLVVLRRRRLVFVAALVAFGVGVGLLLATILGVGSSAVASASGLGISSAQSYTVRPGDTLWSIASKVVGPHGDPRPVVYGFEKELGGANLEPGEVIALP